MKIRIGEKRRYEIVKEIERVEERCSARLMPVDVIFSAVEEAEGRLEGAGIPKKDWKGTMIYIVPEKVSNSYKARAEGTWASIKRFPSGWFLTDVARVPCGKCPYGSSREIIVEVKVEIAEGSRDDPSAILLEKVLKKREIEIYFCEQGDKIYEWK